MNNTQLMAYKLWKNNLPHPISKTLNSVPKHARTFWGSSDGKTYIKKDVAAAAIRGKYNV